MKYYWWTTSFRLLFIDDFSEDIFIYVVNGCWPLVNVVVTNLQIDTYNTYLMLQWKIGLFFSEGFWVHFSGSDSDLCKFYLMMTASVKMTVLTFMNYSISIWIYDYTVIFCRANVCKAVSLPCSLIVV